MTESLGWLESNQNNKLSNTQNVGLFPYTFPIKFPAEVKMAENQSDKLTNSERG